MSPGFRDLLSLEIKKDIADRYFGFRKLIEEDKLDLSTRIRQHSIILQKRISFELIRIYMLLGREQFILTFLELAGLARDTFYDPQFTSLAGLQQRLFAGISLRGFSRRGRFINLLLDCYGRFSVHANQYCLKIAELRKLKNTIDDEIKVFYQQNELGTILGFLKSLGDPETTIGIEGGLETGLAAALEQKMKIDPPPPVEMYLPAIGPLPQLREQKKKLKTLAHAAYDSHGNVFMRNFPVGKACFRGEP